VRRPEVKKAIREQMYAAFTTSLRDERKKAGLTQAKLAKRLRRPQSYVSKYERGNRRLDVIEFLEVARAIKFDPSTFLQRLESK
jgi:transcriptional regulator with XRE-family HTH domain